MFILGISSFYHDSAAAIICDGQIVAAAQEERFTRKKHDSSFPSHAVDYCIRTVGVAPDQIAYVAFYDKPLLKFERLVDTYLSFVPRGFNSFRTAMPNWISDKVFQRHVLERALATIYPDVDWKARLLFSEHHFSHAASAFFPSPFEAAAVLTMDGTGEWATTSCAYGVGNKLSIQREIHFPHSLGLLYSAFTYYCGFRVNSGEYKLMGLAPYGVPKYVEKILNSLIDVKPDGSFRLNMSYFDFCTGLTMTGKKFEELFGRKRRDECDPLDQFYMDVAASVQSVTETIVVKLARAIQRESKLKNLCLAGGVALNCVANGKLHKERIFDSIWIQPAAGDAGGAIGAALAAWYQHLGNPRNISTAQDAMSGSYLGPCYSQSEIEAELSRVGANYKITDDATFIELVTEGLISGKAVGWFQGRMEFGPRSLGGRSILGDPRSPTMQKTLNLKVKFRESFRPFAPAVLREHVENWFDFSDDSPYMLFVAPVKSNRTRVLSEHENSLFGIDKLAVPRSEIPAVTHVDYSARVQTVHEETNPRFHQLLSRFHEKTGCPVLVNTSFNVRGEPIVCTPTDAFRCFMGTDIELLAIGNCILRKEDQNPALKQNYETAFALD